MIDPEIRDQTYQFFLEEVPELLQVLETGLLNLKQARSCALIHDLMRSAHSIKGGAATVGLDTIATIAHRLESILRGLHSEKVELDPELETWLLEAYDCLKKPLQQQVSHGNFDSESAHNDVDRVFTKIEHRLGDVLQEADNYILSSADLGVDMVSSIFEVDVVQGIERLSMVLEKPQEYEIAAELRVQAEVFAGFAEILNLPGFGEIALAATEALNTHPDRILEIVSLALTDFKAARELVLAGDRERGGSPKALSAFLSDAAAEPVDPGCLFSTEAPTIQSLDDFQETLDDLETFLSQGNTETDLTVPTEAIADPEPVVVDPEIVTDPCTISQPQSSSKQSRPQQRSIRETEFRSTVKFNSPANLKVKVDLNRLEEMNNLVGELVINRNSLALQQDQLKGIVRKIQQGLEQFQHLSGKLDELPKPTVNSRPDSQPLFLSSQNESLDDARLFDTLEMESYSDRHSYIHQILEEMMQLEEAVEDLTLFTRQSDRTIRQQQQTLTKLRDELMWARMLPLEKVLNHFPRALRDLSTQYQKPVSLEMEGTEILVDKGILDKLYDPMMHLLRNAFDHGIEMPDIRRKQSKSATGKITIRASHQGNRTLIEISDDGRGLDLMKIARRAIDRGWLSIDRLTQATKEQLLDFIFQPGFSTAERVSELSGRGVGLDVVRSQLQAVKGTVGVDSSPGKGTTFTLSLPLTLTIAKLLICLAGTKQIAVPVASIQEIISQTNIAIERIGEQRVISWREQLLPVHRLADLLEYRYPLSVDRSRTLANGSAMLIIRSEKSNFALEVEDFSTEQEMVIKPLIGAITPPNYVYGCTVMGDGNLIPAIDAVALLAHSKQQDSTVEDTVISLTNTDRDLSIPRVPTVLVVDDSAMIRKTLTLTLQKVGYRVLQAKDGEEAIELLGQDFTIDLIISDLEMPRLNGFELIEKLRQDSVLSSIPFIMLTTRSSHKHRQLALSLGASAYLSKPYIEQEFLDVLKTTIRQPDLPCAV